MRRWTSLLAGALALGLGPVALGCDDGSGLLVVRLQTGLRAGQDVARSDTWVLPGASCELDAAQRASAESRPISRRDQGALVDASFEAATFRVAPGIHTVRVELSRADESAPPRVRCVVVSVQDRRVVRVAFTSGCVAGACPASGGTASFTECLNGRCVEPRCDPDDPSTREACCDRLALGAACDEVPTLCRSASDCPAPSSCSGPLACDRGVCVEPEDDGCGPGLRCDPGLARCVPDEATLDAGPADVGVGPDAAGPRLSPPRPLAPCSLGDVTRLQPTFRWALPPDADGAVFELCEDRECARPLETLRVTGSSARPTVALPPSSVVYWRLRGRAGAREGIDASPTWLFHTPARDVSTGIDTCTGPHLDVDADGIDDLLIGVPRRGASGLMARGVVFLHRGRRALGVEPAPWAEIDGVAEGDLFGGNVTAAGDVNGDGFGDVAVSAHQAMAGLGAVSVFLGGPLGLASSPVVVLPGREIDGGPFAVLGVGDVDGDGYADLAVGAHTEDAGGTDTGTVSVHLGSAAGTLATADVVLRGTTLDGLFGAWLSSGDWNGDGLADLAVGAPGTPVGGRRDVGAVGVYLGSPGGIEARAFLLEGVAGGERFGTLSPRSGDLDGDGLSDLAVGAPVASGAGGARVGLVRVYRATGSELELARTLEGGRADELLGNALASGRDVNGDGYADLLVGAPGARPGGVIDAGEIRIFLGAPAGIPATPAQSLPGGPAESFGNQLAVVGDLDGDGRAELAAHWPSSAVELYSGTPSGVGGPALSLQGMAPLEWGSVAVAE